MKANGIGSETIAQRLNADPDVWHPKEHFKNRRGGWWPAYIQKILKSPAVIGVFKSQAVAEPIEGYFPPIVDRDLYTGNPPRCP
jgi:Recombinase